MTEQALVVAGHGSHRNPDSSTPVHRVVEAVRERGVFAEVRPAFWKESPSIRNVLHTVDADEVTVVPLFVSEGYFVDQVLPREFRLGEQDRAGDDSPTVSYAPPVGTHSAMTDVIGARARRLLDRAPDDRPAAPEDTALAVVGHGTERNPNSSDAVYDHVEALRAHGTFAEVGALFMDESPRVRDARERFDADELVVVPLFVADGFHTRDEIPELLGLTDDPETGYPVPAEVGSRRIWYSSAVGTDPLVVEVVLERAAEAGAALDASSDGTSPRPVRETAGDALVSWVESASGAPGRGRIWGELAIAATDAGYELRHRDDREVPAADLDALSVDELRETVRYDDDGRYRPFSGEATLPAGWVLPGLDREGFLRAASTVYPASVEHWAAESVSDFETVSFREVADRQTGIYDCVADLSREELERTVEACCGNCVKRRVWTATQGETPARPADGPAGEQGSVDPAEGSISCREACSFLVAAAREFHQREGEPDRPNEPQTDRPNEPQTDRSNEPQTDRSNEPQTDHLDTAVPRGDLTDPANVYRLRYRRARASSSDHYEDRFPRQP